MSPHSVPGKAGHRNSWASSTEQARSHSPPPAWLPPQQGREGGALGRRKCFFTSSTKMVTEILGGSGGSVGGHKIVLPASLPAMTPCGCGSEPQRPSPLSGWGRMGKAGCWEVGRGDAQTSGGWEPRTCSPRSGSLDAHPPHRHLTSPSTCDHNRDTFRLVTSRYEGAEDGGTSWVPSLRGGGVRLVLPSCRRGK